MSLKMHHECGSCCNLPHLTEPDSVFPTRAAHSWRLRQRSFWSYVIYADGEWAVTPAPDSLLNLVQRQHKAVFHYRVTLFCSNWKQFKRKWFNRMAPEFKHLMTGLTLIFNEVVGLHLHQWNWKHLSWFLLEALDPIKTEITAVVTDLDTVV